MGTNQWLRLVVYERVPRKYGTVLTFGLSALWHGFYAGYYITFATGALFVAAARVVSYETRWRKRLCILHHLVVFKFVVRHFVFAGSQVVPPSLPVQRALARILRYFNGFDHTCFYGLSHTPVHFTRV